VLTARNWQPARVLPPGPRLPGAVQSLAYVTRPIPFLQRCRERYGDVFTVHAAPYGRLVVLAHPELVKQVFTGAPTTFHTGRVRRVLAPALGRHSLLLLDEDEHLRERRLMLPPFHGEALERYRDLIDEIIRADLEEWPADRPLAVLPRMQAVTLEVILRVVIGTREPARLAPLRSALQDVLGLNMTLLLFASMLEREPHWLPWWRGFARLRARTHELLGEEIRRRRADPQGDDVLSLLVSARDSDGDMLSDEELRDELVTLLLAGHETTATALSWTLECLVRHPHELEALRDGDDARIDAVIREALRVRPVINEVGRDITEPIEVGGHRLPAGTRVMSSVALIQRDARFYDDPEAFRPERFLDGAGVAPYTWIPFGGGVRRCLGASFALMEMAVVLRAVLERFDVRAARPEPEPSKLRAVTYVPARGAEVVVRPRVTAPVPA
jgi:cytochrome P450 family 135